MQSVPFLAQQLMISARHQARFRYVFESQSQPVSKCFVFGATTTKLCERSRFREAARVDGRDKSKETSDAEPR